ncbi:hypothetical protein E2C01_051818 [Portunus trituberculatus]|uniref:Uncharacterized protein n=1 Tax=Portunus trituberculatus TaxID=210409 RepID=A0A5B7GC13_PORTR|nr:hypothetical protein [Portunus trituberculatus]
MGMALFSRAHTRRLITPVQHPSDSLSEHSPRPLTQHHRRHHTAMTRDRRAAAATDSETAVAAQRSPRLPRRHLAPPRPTLPRRDPYLDLPY